MKDDKCGYFDVLNVDEDKVTNAGLAGNCVINYKVETYNVMCGGEGAANMIQEF